MTNIEADVDQFERGQVISTPTSLPGSVQLARLRNNRGNAKRLVVVKRSGEYFAYIAKIMDLKIH